MKVEIDVMDSFIARLQAAIITRVTDDKDADQWVAEKAADIVSGKIKDAVRQMITDKVTHDLTDAIKKMLAPAIAAAVANEATKLVPCVLAHVKTARKFADKNHFFDKDIEELELHTRSFNRLKSSSILSIGQLCEMTENELLRIPNMGRHSLHDIKIELEKRGLRLRETGK